jgi:ADP-heptose:LPS heptosyltransferase
MTQDTPQKILLIQLRQLGDILLTTPCIREILKEHPNAEISFLSHPMGKLVLNGNPYVKEHYTYDPKAGVLAEWKLARLLRSQNFDLVIDFMNNPRSAFYARYTGAKDRIAFKSARFWAYTGMVERQKISEYIVTEKFGLLRKAGLAPKDVSLDLPWFEKDYNGIKDFMGPLLTNAPVISLSPTHRHAVRQWGRRQWAELADFLVREWGAKIVWIWGPGEEEFVDHIMDLTQSKTLKAPATSFRELAALLAQGDLFIGTSNGPSHVAVAAKTLSFQLHGPTQGPAWCPNNENHRFIEGLSGNQKAMEFISLEEVVKGLNSMKDLVYARAANRTKLTTWQ